MKIKKKSKKNRGGGVRSRSGWGDQVGYQGGCEQSIEVFVKIQKKSGGRGLGGTGSAWWGVRSGSGWGVRLDVKEELKFL